MSTDDRASHKINSIEIDEDSLAAASRDQEQERQVAIFDLLEGNYFEPTEASGGPYDIRLSLLENRLAFDIRADEALLDAPVPPMVLPTLVENAIKHGLSPLPQGGRIGISAAATGDGRLAIEVADNGQGFVADGGSGVGLANTRSRLAALFGDRAALELRAAQGGGVVARVVLPLMPAAAGVAA